MFFPNLKFWNCPWHLSRSDQNCHWRTTQPHPWERAGGRGTHRIMQNLNSPTVGTCMFERNHSADPPTQLFCLPLSSFCLGCCRSTYRKWLPEGRELFIEHLLQAHCRAAKGGAQYSQDSPFPVLPAGINGYTSAQYDTVSTCDSKSFPYWVVPLWGDFYMYSTTECLIFSF